MKKMTKWLAMILMVVMLFSMASCGSSSEKVDTSVEDLCLATTGIPGDTVLFTVDGEDVTAEHFFYWLAYDISYADYYYSQYGLNLDLNELSESLIEDARNSAAQTVLLGPKTEELLHHSLSDDVIEEVNDGIEELKEEFGGEAEFHDSLRKIGIDEDLYYTLILANYYYEMLEEEAFEGHPTYDEAETYAEDNDLMYVKIIMLLTVDENYEPLDEEELEEKKALAEEILERLQNSEDVEEEFDILMNEYSEDTGLESYPDGYLFSSGGMVSEVEDATRELEFGQISGIVEHEGTEGESYSGYHIILRLDPAESELLDESWLSEQVNELVYSWREESEFIYSDEYGKIDVEAFYDKYIEYQEAFEEESQEN